MTKKNNDKERDIALQTPEKGKKSKSKKPPPRAGSDEEKPLKRGKSYETDKDESGTQGGQEGNAVNKGEEGAQGYGKYKK
jgi:hypothetical protein